MIILITAQCTPAKLVIYHSYMKWILVILTTRSTISIENGGHKKENAGYEA